MLLQDRDFEEVFFFTGRSRSRNTETVPKAGFPRGREGDIKREVGGSRIKKERKVWNVKKPPATQMQPKENAHLEGP